MSPSWGFVEGHTAQILMHAGRLPATAVNENDVQGRDQFDAEGDEDDAGDTGMGPINSLGGLIAVINGSERGRNGQWRTRSPSGRFTARPPRTDSRPDSSKRIGRHPKCPNCGGEHTKLECKTPMIAVSVRRCFECTEAGHTVRQCPTRKDHGAGGQRTNAFSDGNGGLTMPIFGFNDAGSEGVDEFGFTTVVAGNRPAPRAATLADSSAHGNIFDEFAGRDAEAAVATMPYVGTVCIVCIVAAAATMPCPVATSPVPTAPSQRTATISKSITSTAKPKFT